MDLRKLVGHRKLLMAGAGIFPVRDGRVLLQKRKDDGLWADHGGSVELSESVEDTARRELSEETGLTAGKLELIGFYSGKEMDHTYPNGDQVSMICFYYLCRDFEGDIRLQEEEVAQVRWFPLDALPGEDEMLPCAYRALLDGVALLRKEQKEGKA